jgi:hypothetical protein
MGIATPTTAAVSSNETLALVVEIPQHVICLGVFEQGPNRYPQNHVLTTPAVHVFPFSVPAPLGKDGGMVAEIEQGM